MTDTLRHDVADGLRAFADALEGEGGAAPATETSHPHPNPLNVVPPDTNAHHEPSVPVDHGSDSIPGFRGAPILSYEQGFTEIDGFTMNTDEVKTLRNVKIKGKILVRRGTLVIEHFEWDGLQGAVCGATAGGKIIAKYGKVHNAEDGFKNNVELEQVWVGDLYHRPGAHGDCLQLEGSADAKVHRCYFNAFYNSGELANSAFIAKSDIAPGSNQKLVVKSSLLDGGNYTVDVNVGHKGGTPHVEVIDSFWGGHARYGVDANGHTTDYRRNNMDQAVRSLHGSPAKWDVTKVSV